MADVWSSVNVTDRRDRSLESVLSRIEGPRDAPPARIDGRPIVLFRTPWQRLNDGWAISARAWARAMAGAGIDVRLVGPIEVGAEVDQSVLDEVRDYVSQRTTEWDLHVYSVPLDSAKILAPALSDMQLQRGPQVMHCMFERQYLEPELVASLNKLTGTWAQCSANRDVLKKFGVHRCEWIPYPYFDDDPHLQLRPPRESKRFYWIGRFEPRKAPDQLLRAFFRAFRPGEATLTMKLSPYPHPGQYSSPEEVILHELAEPDVIRQGWDAPKAVVAVRVLRSNLSREEMLKLHASHDVYASASRGEGLDLPAFAAKLAGRKIVTTDSGGPRDFVDDGDVLVPSSGVVAADRSYNWGDGATYADYRLGDLVAALQVARASAPQGSRVPENHRAENVSDRMREWVGVMTGKG